jgi:membrane fusion protein, multidrug efflux system
MPSPHDPHSVEIQGAPGKTTKEEDMRKRFVFGVAAVVVAIGAGFAIKAGKGAAAVPATAAMAANAPDAAASQVPLDFTASEATRPVTLALPQMVEFSGALVAPNTAMVRAKATGTLLTLDVQEGQRVKAGELLGRIDISDLQTKVAERTANLAAVKTTMDQAQRTHDSNIRLANEKFISPIALEASKSSLDNAKAQVAAAQAALDSARITLRDASLIAPISGIVSKRYVVAGEKVSAEQQVVNIVDLHMLELAGTVGTQEVARLSPGMPVTLKIEGIDQPLQGKLARIAPAAEAGTRSIGVAVQLPNPKETLRAGQYAVAQVQIGDATPRLTVPISAISSASGQEYVWTVEDGKLLRRTVTTGRRDPVRQRAEVLEGLKPDVPVLGARFDNLREGAKARVVAVATAATPKPLAPVAAVPTVTAR